MKLLIFQVGDYGSAYQAMLDGAEETYRNQYETVRFVASLTDRFSVTTLSVGDTPHDVSLAPKLRSVRVEQDDRQVSAALCDLNPDIIVCRSPSLPVLSHAQTHACPTLPMLADTFLPRGGLRGQRDRLYFRKLRKALTQDHIPCICNHNINAARTLVDGIGLDPARVLPWDWPSIPANPVAKTAASDKPSAVYAGMIYAPKGVGDALDAIGILKEQGMRVTLDLLGNAFGDQSINDWKSRAVQLDLGDQVVFHGLVSNTTAAAMMRDRDIVLVPSRHHYPEGMPKTLIEGLASRSPVVISDHPVFRDRLIHAQDCMQFQASTPKELAKAMRRLFEEPDLYQRLSANAPEALSKLNTGMHWFDVIRHFLDDPHDKHDWVAENALPAYDI